MKKTFTLAVSVLVLLFLLAGCDENPIEIKENGITRLEIYSLPNTDTYNRIYTDSEKIAVIIEYLTGLSLQVNFPENPDEYSGMAKIITIIYDDGTEVVYNHFGNMFFGIRTDDTLVWYRMKYDEAIKFENLIQINSSDE